MSQFSFYSWTEKSASKLHAPNPNHAFLATQMFSGIGVPYRMAASCSRVILTAPGAHHYWKKYQDRNETNGEFLKQSNVHNDQTLYTHCNSPELASRDLERQLPATPVYAYWERIGSATHAKPFNTVVHAKERVHTWLPVYVTPLGLPGDWPNIKTVWKSKKKEVATMHAHSRSRSYWWQWCP